VSVLCEAIPLLPDITRPAERLVRAIDLEGCSMVEFRRDQVGRPMLMEVNPRMGGSIGLAISAGVNFPTAACVEAGPIPEDQGRPDVPPRERALATFLADFARPSNSLDGVELGDMRPLLSEMNRLVVQHGLGRARRLLPH
jgi:hypothetical protein